MGPLASEATALSTEPQQLHPPQKNTIDVVSFCPCQSELLALQVNMHTAEKVVLVERKNEKTISSKLETNT